MATLTIRNLPDEVRDRLRLRAAQNGRSMEAEARQLIAEVLGNGERADRGADWKAGIRVAQELVARYIPKGSYTVDDFLAERRAETAQVESRWERLEREAAEAARKTRP